MDEEKKEYNVEQKIQEIREGALDFADLKEIPLDLQNLIVEYVSNEWFCEKIDMPSNTIAYEMLDDNQELIATPDKIIIIDCQTKEILKKINIENIYQVKKLKNKNIAIITAPNFDKDLIHIYDQKMKKLLKILPCNTPFNPITDINDKFLIADDIDIKIYNLNNESIQTLHERDVISMISLENDMIATGSDSLYKVIKIWNLATGLNVKTLLGHKGGIYSLLKLRNGKLVSGSSDNTIKIWNLETEQCEMTLAGHKNNIYALLESQIGELVSGSSDRTIKIWNLNTGECNKTIKFYENFFIPLIKENFALSETEENNINIFWDYNWYTCINQVKELKKSTKEKEKIILKRLQKLQENEKNKLSTKLLRLLNKTKYITRQIIAGIKKDNNNYEKLV